MTDKAGQIGNVRFPTAGQKAGHLGSPPLGGDPLSGLSARAPLPPRKRNEYDHDMRAQFRTFPHTITVAASVGSPIGAALNLVQDIETQRRWREEAK